MNPSNEATVELAAIVAKQRDQAVAALAGSERRGAVRALRLVADNVGALSQKAIAKMADDIEGGAKW